MNRNLQMKFALVVILAGLSLWSLWPTIQLRMGGDSLDEATRSKLEAEAIRLGLDLQGGMYLVLEVDEEQLTEELDAEEAVNRTIQILRDRIDQFGVSEPVIQAEGTGRIVVQLPGLTDADRAREVIGRTAKLDFRLVREKDEVDPLLAKIDQVLAGYEAPDDTTETAPAPVTDRPFTRLVSPYLGSIPGVGVHEDNVDTVREILARPAVRRVMPSDAAFLFGSEEIKAREGGVARVLYLVENEIRISGEDIENARTEQDTENPGQLRISLDLTGLGGRKFHNVTRSNVNRKLAIVLDGVVHSAPNIQGPIPGGRATISGGFQTHEEARDLAVVLRAGAFPVDVDVAEERTVGPSLGQDSIDRGVNSVLIGGALVVVFMIIYYKVAGVLATLGLTLTLVLLLGILSQLGLVLTLPGIAGIILTVGMAVDANVLIFERIREELRRGKTVNAAVDAGYAQATRAIVDANITTFIAAFVLYQFGTGPIKGFAVTLAIGILTSMFSALVFTRSVYQAWLSGRSPRSLSV